MIYEMVVLAGPQATLHFYLELIGGEVSRFFTLAGVEITEPVQDWALAYTCVGSDPVATPAWYTPSGG